MNVGKVWPRETSLQPGACKELLINTTRYHTAPTLSSVHEMTMEGYFLESQQKNAGTPITRTCIYFVTKGLSSLIAGPDDFSRELSSLDPPTLPPPSCGSQNRMMVLEQHDGGSVGGSSLID